MPLIRCAKTCSGQRKETDSAHPPAMSTQELEDTFNAITDMITVHDGELNIVYANRAAEEILNLPSGKVGKIKCYEYYHGTGAPPERCPSCNCFKTRLPAIYEMFEPHLGRFLEIRTMPRFDDGNRLIKVVHIVRDVTEHRKAEEESAQLRMQLLHSQKMQAIGVLTESVAHGFKNLLTPVVGYGHILREELRKDSALFPYVQRILEAAHQAAHLTQRLLDFSRKQAINPKRVDLNHIVRKAETLLSVIIAVKNIRTELRLTEDEVIVTVDADQMEQVLMNLMINARDAMPCGGTLSISTRLLTQGTEFHQAHGFERSAGYALISVADTGVGMDEETRGRIFEPFFTTKGEGKGTGLGLSIVHGVIKQYGGYIEVRSEAGKGTTFDLYLPVTGPEAGQPGTV